MDIVDDDGVADDEACESMKEALRWGMIAQKTILPKTMLLSLKLMSQVIIAIDEILCRSNCPTC